MIHSCKLNDSTLIKTKLIWNLNLCHVYFDLVLLNPVLFKSYFSACISFLSHSSFFIFIIIKIFSFHAKFILNTFLVLSHWVYHLLLCNFSDQQILFPCVQSCNDTVFSSPTFNFEQNWFCWISIFLQQNHSLWVRTNIYDQTEQNKHKSRCMVIGIIVTIKASQDWIQNKNKKNISEPSGTQPCINVYIYEK